MPVNPPMPFQPGETWNFQAWYRDTGGTNNFTDAVSVLTRSRWMLPPRRLDANDLRTGPSKRTRTQ